LSSVYRLRSRKLNGVLILCGWRSFLSSQRCLSNNITSTWEAHRKKRPRNVDLRSGDFLCSIRLLMLVLCFPSVLQHPVEFDLMLFLFGLVSLLTYWCVAVYTFHIHSANYIIIGILKIY